MNIEMNPRQTVGEQYKESKNRRVVSSIALLLISVLLFCAVADGILNGHGTVDMWGLFGLATSLLAVTGSSGYLFHCLTDN